VGVYCNHYYNNNNSQAARYYTTVKAINFCRFSQGSDMFLSPVEQAYLNGTRQFTKPQQRYIRYRLNKKLRLLGEELTSVGIPTDLESRDAAAAQLLRLDNARPQGYETERSLLLRETVEKKPAALVAQPAERRFRKPAVFLLCCKAAAAKTLGRGFKSHLGLSLLFSLSFSSLSPSTKPRSAG
jgi:hypothetical protein